MSDRSNTTTAPLPEEHTASSGENRSPRGSVPGIWVVVGATAATIILAGIRLGTPRIWLDEAYSVALASLPMPDLLAVFARTEASGSLYFLILSLWLPFNSAEWFLRLPGLLFAAATVPVFYGLARLIVDRLTAHLATLLLAANGMLLAWGREVRQYSLALLLATAATYAFVRALRRKDTRWLWAWALLGGLGIYAHLYVLFVVLAHLCALPFVTGRSQRRALWAPAATLIALAVPMAVYVLTASTAQLQGNPTLSLRSFVDLARELAGAPATLRAVPAAALVLIGIATAVHGFYRHRDDDSRWRLVPIAWLGVPVSVATVASFIEPALFQTRYFVVVLPAFVLLAATGLTWVVRQPATATVAAIALLLLGLPRVLSLYDAPGHEDWESVVELIADAGPSGDAVMIEPHYYLPPVDYYAERLVEPGWLPMRVYSTTTSRANHFTGRPGIVEFVPIDNPADAGVGASRLWYVAGYHAPAWRDLRSDGQHTSIEGLEAWEVREVWHFPAASVALLQAPEREGDEP